MCEHVSLECGGSVGVEGVVGCVVGGVVGGVVGLRKVEIFCECAHDVGPSGRGVVPGGQPRWRHSGESNYPVCVEVTVTAVQPLPGLWVT